MQRTWIPSPLVSAAARVDRLRARVHERLEQERERRYLVAVVFAIGDRSRHTAASVLAGALAFRLFLTLLPLTLVLVVGLGYLKSAGGQPSAVVKQFGIKGVLATTINHSASFSDPGRAVVLLFGVIALLTGARTTVQAVRAIHALVWGIPPARWRRSGRATVMLLGATVVAFACGGIAARVRSEVGVPIGIGASIAMAGVVGVGWLGASWLLPHREGISWSELVPGAVLVGAGFAVLQALTANVLGPKLAHEQALYGSLAVSFVVLGWLYLIGRLLVAAPLLNIAITEQQCSRAGATKQRSA